MTILHIADYCLDDIPVLRLIEAVASRLPRDEFALALVSSGEALERARLLAARLGGIEVIDSPSLGHRFAVALGAEAQYSGPVQHEILADTFRAADVLWFPSLHNHLPAHPGLPKVVAGFHRSSPVEMAEFLADKADPIGAASATGLAAMEDMATRRVMASAARLVAPSRRLADYLARTYGRPAAMVPLPTPSLLEVPAEPVPDLPARYLLCLGGIDALGNHESLLMAQARLKSEGRAFPLALTGEGIAGIATGSGYRGAYLKGLIEHLGLVLGSDLHLLDELGPGALKTAFSQSSGAILPALAEGPALLLAGQAAELGVKLAVSDMPGMRDYAERRVLAPLWFGPGAVDEIAGALVALREAAPRPPAALPDTSWEAVAQSYLTLFREQAILAASQSGGR